MNVIRRNSPHARFTFTARDRSRNSNAIMKDEATISFVRNVDIVASQIALCLFRLLDSSAVWMPRASENESAIAIVRIPPITASLEPVPAFRPIIRPSVVIMPEVRPNDTPVFIDSLM